MMEKNKLYLIIAIVVIVGIVAIFSLTFLTAGDQNLTGAAIWSRGGHCEDWSTDVTKAAPTNSRDCGHADGTWVQNNR